MALTDAEKVSIKRHLGMNSAAEANYPWVDVFWAVDKVLTTLSSAAETETRSILTRLTGLETSLDAAKNRLKASAVGSIDLNDREHDKLWRELRRWRRELAVLLGVPLVNSSGIVVA